MEERFVSPVPAAERNSCIACADGCGKGMQEVS